MATQHVRGDPPTTNAGRRFPPEVLTDSEVCDLMDACGEGLTACLPNRAVIATLFRGGLRVSEALYLSTPRTSTPAWEPCGYSTARGARRGRSGWTRGRSRF